MLRQVCQVGRIILLEFNILNIHRSRCSRPNNNQNFGYLFFERKFEATQNIIEILV